MDIGLGATSRARDIGAFELACIRTLSGQLDWTGVACLSIQGRRDRTTDSGARGRIQAPKTVVPLSLSAVEQLGATADLSIDQTGWFKAIISPKLVSLVTNNPARGQMQFEAKIR